MDAAILTLQDVGFEGQIDYTQPRVKKAQYLVATYNEKAPQIDAEDRASIIELLKNKPWYQGSLNTVSSHPLYRRTWKDHLPYWVNINYPNFFVLVGLYEYSASLDNIRESVERLYNIPVSPLTLDWPGIVDPQRLEELQGSEATLRRNVEVRKAGIFIDQYNRNAAQRARDAANAVPAAAANIDGGSYLFPNRKKYSETTHAAVEEDIEEGSDVDTVGESGDVGERDDDSLDSEDDEGINDDLGDHSDNASVNDALFDQDFGHVESFDTINDNANDAGSKTRSRRQQKQGSTRCVLHSRRKSRSAKLCRWRWNIGLRLARSQRSIDDDICTESRMPVKPSLERPRHEPRR